MLVFIKNYQAKSKSTGKYYQSITIAEVKPDDTGALNASVKDFFVDVNMDLEGLQFGDQVECKFEEPTYFGGAPQLVKVKRVKETPYVVEG